MRLWVRFCSTVWVSRCMHLWVSRCVRLWVSRCVRLWVSRCMRLWVRVCSTAPGEQLTACYTVVSTLPGQSAAGKLGSWLGMLHLPKEALATTRAFLFGGSTHGSQRVDGRWAQVWEPEASVPVPSPSLTNNHLRARPQNFPCPQPVCGILGLIEVTLIVYVTVTSIPYITWSRGLLNSPQYCKMFIITVPGPAFTVFHNI